MANNFLENWDYFDYYILYIREVNNFDSHVQTINEETKRKMTSKARMKSSLLRSCEHCNTCIKSIDFEIESSNAYDMWLISCNFN